LTGPIFDWSNKVREDASTRPVKSKPLIHQPGESKPVEIISLTVSFTAGPGSHVLR